jgi:acetoin utilization deacetylase AcuC-like enzyme
MKHADVIKGRVLSMIPRSMSRRMNDTVHLFHNLVEMSKHIAPSGFPERPVRLAGIETALYEKALWTQCVDHLVTKPVDRALLVREYSESEVARWEQACERAVAGPTEDDRSGDIYWSKDTMKSVFIAAGATVEAVKTVLDAYDASGDVEHAFAIIRPPGHHCFDTPTGFCIANNVVLGARHALGRGKKVAIVDWDYHFGDGTAEAFLKEPNVMFASLHCEFDRRGRPTYPHSALKDESLATQTSGRMFNIQWPTDDAGDCAYADAFVRAIVPAFRRFAPDIVLVSAGYDAIKGDTLAGMNLSPRVFELLTSTLKTLGLPIVCVLEGGYDPGLLGKGVCATVEGLLAKKTTLEVPGPSAAHRAVVDDVVEQLRLDDECA